MCAAAPNFYMGSVSIVAHLLPTKYDYDRSGFCRLVFLQVALHVNIINQSINHSFISDTTSP